MCGWANRSGRASGAAKRVAAALLVTSLLAACAGSGTRSSIQYERNAVGSVLRAGFSEIRDKGLVERSTGSLFIAGLRNIGKLDPDLQFTATDTRVSLDIANLELFGMARPGDDDLQGWVDVTTLMFEAARKLSPAAANADREALYQLMFDGALLQIDPYSRYSSNRNAGFNRASRNGFIGIGIEYEMRVGGAYVSSVIDGGPAEAAGLKEGDLIAAIDGRDVLDANRDTIRRLVAGPADTTVKVSVFRDGVPDRLSFVVRRELIVPHTVQWSMTGDGVAVIRVHNFNVRTANDVSQAVAAIKDTTNNEVKGYVLDLRGDPGGLLDQAVDVSDLFLDSGSIVTLSGRHPGSKQFYTARAGDIADGKPLVLLVDGKSASSSEIAAAALVDNGRAITVGTNTLGKGSVQTLIRLPNDGEIALTWAEVLSPAGYRVHGLGLLPSICTSSYAGNLAAVLDSVKRREAPWQALPASWGSFERTAENIGTMRGLCPAQSRPDEENDEVLAVRMAADRALYAQASSTNLAAAGK
jgi:carboxyl-terminal processing protease